MPNSTITMTGGHMLRHLLSIVVLAGVAITNCACSIQSDEAARTGTPAAIIGGYYKALETGDYPLFNRVVHKEVKITEEQFRKRFVNSDKPITKFRIIEQKHYEKSDAFAKAGDLWVLVEEIRNEGKSTQMYFNLRFTDKGWLITNWNVPEKQSEMGLNENHKK
jgi:hypothetical protein